MIKEINIQNLATIEDLHLTFGHGLNILTGETGAGKSLFLEAFAWLTGLRADRGMIREGKERASVEMVMENPPSSIQEKLIDQGWTDIENLIIFRQISRSGSSRIILNNRHVTLGFLRELLESILLLHSQNQSVDLLKKSYHMSYLDAMHDDKLQNAISNYQFAWQELQEAQQNYDAFCSGILSATEENFLRFQAEELDAAELSEAELSELEEEQQVLQNGKEIAAKGQRIYDQIHGPQQMLELSEGVRRDLQDLCKFYGDLIPFVEEINALSDSLLEIGSFLQGRILDLDLNPTRMEEVESRLLVYYDFSRKYDMNLPELLAYQLSIREQLDQYELAEDRKVELLKLRDEKRALAEQAAVALSNARKTTAEWMSGEIMTKIHHMEMREAKFSVNFHELPDLTVTGKDDLEFFIQTNLGSASLPLRKIASGGETSRILLALLIAQGKSGKLKTMVFDEIDAGLSGKAALRVAEILDDLSNEYQIICVTHQPQVASFADQYYQLLKTSRENSTFTQVVERNEEERIQAVAQLVSGDHVQKSGYEYAREIIRYARERKEQNR